MKTLSLAFLALVCLLPLTSLAAVSRFTGKTTATAWRSKPSWYIVSKQDQTISPDLQRFLAKRMAAQTVEIEAGHLSRVSHAQEVADVILQAARAGSHVAAQR